MSTAAEESNLVTHARAELERIGQFKEDPEFAESIVGAVAAFAAYGHSGGSAGAGIAMLHELLQFKPLGPLTDDPDEWQHVGAQEPRTPTGTGEVWQSRRRSDAFSEDGGKTYYLVDDDPVTVHESEAASDRMP